MAIEGFEEYSFVCDVFLAFLRKLINILSGHNLVSSIHIPLLQLLLLHFNPLLHGFDFLLKLFLRVHIGHILIGMSLFIYDCFNLLFELFGLMRILLFEEYETHKSFVLSHKLDAIDKILVVIWHETTVVSKVQISGSISVIDVFLKNRWTKQFKQDFGRVVN